MLNFKFRLKICLLTLVSLFSVNVLAIEPETVHLQLRWTHQFQFAGYYAALEKGYYEKAGLNVVIHEASTTTTAIVEVQKNNAQYGVDNSEILHARLNGAPLVALAAIFQHSPSVLVTRENILSPHDLIGKKIMLMLNDGDDDIWNMISNEGISKTQIEILPNSFNLQDFIDGKVDAYAAYSTDEVYTLENQHIKFNVLNPRNYSVDFYSDILFTTEDEIRQHPERAKAFHKASIDGWRYALEHPDEIVDLLINKYHVKKTKAALLFEAEAMRALIVPDLLEIGHMNPSRWEAIANTFVKAGIVDPKAVAEKLPNFTPDFDFKVDKTRFQKYLATGIVAFSIAVFICTILLIAYMSMRRENKHRRRLAKQNEVLNRQITQMQKMESIQKMTAGVAHEFNNILMCILGYNEMTQYLCEDVTDESLRKDFENNCKQVDTAGKRAATLINNMLTYCRQDTVKTNINVKSTKEIIQTVVADLDKNFTKKIKIELALASDKNINIDAFDLRRVLAELLNNARDAMGEYGAKITISLKQTPDFSAYCTNCASSIHGDFIELSVADNGIGMDSKMINRIFDPFFTTKEQGEGTGLGLSTVSGIVHNYHGHILVDSKSGVLNLENSRLDFLNQGTTFRLLFPVVIENELNDKNEFSVKN